MFRTTAADGFNGMFLFTIKGERLKIIASDGEGWKHVSVSKQDQPTRVPNWELMCAVKELFFGDAWAVQFHPPKSEYVNNHPGCLHLWQPDTHFPTPDSLLVGYKQKTPDDVKKESKSEALANYISANKCAASEREI